VTSAATSPEFIRFVAETYKDDLTGYRIDILGRKPNPATLELEQSIVKNKRTAAGTGHGIGKTALGADAIHWFISTRPHPAIVATANTEDQLTTKLWRELNKTNQRALNREWFEWKQSTFTMFKDPTAQAVALAWSEHNPEAFAGTHEDHVLGVFDEASAIARSIFNSFAGAMSTRGARWLLLGNSTRTEGYFYDAVHGKMKARKDGDTARGYWNSFVIPCSASPFVDPTYISDMERQFGKDSDEYRIRVLGLPPRTDPTQFISPAIVTAAQERHVPMFNRWPLILGADVGRGDRSVLVPRRGRKVSDRIQILTGSRTTDFARGIIEEIKMYRGEEGLEANVVVEELGMGVGVVETIEDLGYSNNVWGVNTGASPNEGNKELYTNLRCEMWGEMKEWLEGDVELPNNAELFDDLTVIKKKPNVNGKLRLETKEEMRRRNVRSPDVGDALALTFAVPFDLLPERPASHDDAWRHPSNSSVPAGASWMSN
jgi:hypothetical protein